MPGEISYEVNMENIDWGEMKLTLAADKFDNGRTPEQLQASFENSYAAVVAYAESRIIGTARVLSDGACNAYIVDVWTLSRYRKQGVASTMMRTLEQKLNGQHSYLFTDDATEFYRKLGYAEDGTGLGKVVGRWLQKE